MSSDDSRPGADESFLARWSRRKRQSSIARESAYVRPETEFADERSKLAERPAPARAVPSELPPIESLDGLKSDYAAFMGKTVDETARRSALKKLFSDPHFNQMDGLDTYIGDYSIEDPIPDAMLRALNQARGLSLFSAAEENSEGAAPAIPRGSDTPALQDHASSQPETAAPAATRDLPDATATDQAGDRVQGEK